MPVDDDERTAATSSTGSRIRVLSSASARRRWRLPEPVVSARAYAHLAPPRPTDGRPRPDDDAAG